MVEVTNEALQIVKRALKDFKTDIKNISGNAKNEANLLIQDGRSKVSGAEQDVLQSETNICDLTKMIEVLEDKLSQICGEVRGIQSKVFLIMQHMELLDNQVATMRIHASVLQSQLSDTDDDEQRTLIKLQIYELKNRINQNFVQRDNLDKEKQNLALKKEQLNQEISISKSKKSHYEEKLNIEKSRCNKLKSKLERLKNAFVKMESDLISYADAVHKFALSASSNSQNNVSAVDRCILSIDDYESVNL